MAFISFTKVDLPYGWMGNMAPYPIEFEGKRWLTSEALFQAMRFEDEEIRELIRVQKSPMAAKMKAKANKDKMVVVPMSDKDVENMQTCLKLKFTQHKLLSAALIKTTPHIIVEDIGNRNGTRHFFWGAKRNIKNEWEGTNTMGKLLMAVRQELST